MRILEFRVQKSDLRQTKFAEYVPPPLGDGEARVRIEKFGFTANNVTYAVMGDRIGYWRFFPADEPFGVIPVWGYAEVEESRSSTIKPKDRLWGYWPMASHATLNPGKRQSAWFEDATPHRQTLPALYNRYYFTDRDPPAMRALEDRRCVLFPLFATSYILYDYLLDNDFFGARQILIGSASSKTGFGLASLLKRHEGDRPAVIGLTSARNAGFVERLGVCDRVLSYDNVNSLDSSIPTGFVDMAGSGDLIGTLHQLFGDYMKVSSIVGVTHWEAERLNKGLPGAKPTMFFAPAQVAKRDAQWGVGALLRRAVDAWIDVTRETTEHLSIKRVYARQDVQSAYLETLDGKTPPNIGLLMSLSA